MYSLKARLLIDGEAYYTTNFDNEFFSLEVLETEDAIKGTITAKKEIFFKGLSISKEYKFGPKTLFFANGYQSWSTTEEHRASDTTKDKTALLDFFDFGKYMVGAMSDYSFTTYGKKGCFHSHTFTYLREEGSTDITLLGSRSERKGFTIFDVDMNAGSFSIVKDIDGLKLTEGSIYDVFDICIIRDKYDAAFDRYFFDFCGFSKPKVERLAGYTSWYNYFSKINEDILMRDLGGLDRVQDKTQIFQIDDGYESAVGDWLIPDKKKFPNGLKPIAKAAHEKGYLAGIWLAPLCAQLFSKTARKHPDWLVKDINTGKKLIGHFGWGGAYALDIYNEGAREYIKHFFDVILNDWGFDMVKLDFLFISCIQPRDGKTRGEIMCDSVDLLREACGDKIILGCGVPLGACMGVFDACRIGPDANKVYKGNLVNTIAFSNEIPSSRYAIVNSIFRRGLDGRAFANDPDVFFLRDDNLKYSLEQKLLLASVNDITGSIIFMSDNAGDYDEATVETLKYFFSEKDIKVKLAEYESADDMVLEYSVNGEDKQLKFNLKTGKSNIKQLI